jgi:predicted helicase
MQPQPDTVKRLIAFEMQLGPFAVAQLRILAEIVDLTGAPPSTPTRMFVTNTLGNPNDDEDWIPGILAPIAKSRKDANKIKRDEPITVVIGNPPYKEKAKGRGGWIEGENAEAEKSSPLADWTPPKEWKLGAHGKHLRNLYVYFWRWATWKVYDHDPAHNTGIVCFITVAGFVGGPGFQKMRDYLRRTCDDIWVIDCSPEGYQPEVNTRIFQGVQQPVCIVLASRSAQSQRNVPAIVRFQRLPQGRREEKFEALKKVSLNEAQWVECPTGWRSPFLPASTGAWAAYPKLEDLFNYNGSGVMPGRTWVIAPDKVSLEQRWAKLTHAREDEREKLFHPHGSEETPGDRHSKRIVKEGLPGFPARSKSVADDKGPMMEPVSYGFRSFDRQWIIPDNRLINRPNPQLWRVRSKDQIYLTAFTEESPTSGPALTFTNSIPDLHHYKGSFGGRVFPLLGEGGISTSNFRPKLLGFLSKTLGMTVNADDLFSYIAAVAAHPAYTARFQGELLTPGLRIPLTTDASVFKSAIELGRSIIWLHTFGESLTDQKAGRPDGPPRLSADRRPKIPRGGEIPSDAGEMPDTIDYDGSKKRLLVGSGYVENVEPAVWKYEVSGKQIILQWFSYRKADRERPIMGDRRPPSPLGKIQPDHWLPEYTTDLLNLLNVLGLLVDLEPKQAALLEQICSSPTIPVSEFESAGALEKAPTIKRKTKPSDVKDFFESA